MPRRVIVVLDEAYNEYLPDEVQADTVRWLAQFPNLVITRNVAGVRVGFRADSPRSGVTPWNGVRQPFNDVSVVAQAAAGA